MVGIDNGKVPMGRPGWLRRLMTRLLALVPAVIAIALAGSEGLYRLLVLSQVVLSLQLPFAVVPLVHFTSDRRKMGEFASPSRTAAPSPAGASRRRSAASARPWSTPRAMP